MYFDIQVKSSRNYNYVFARKDKFDVNQDNLFLALVLFKEDEYPNLYLIPANAWRDENKLFKNKDYIGLKSKPEWGINLSTKNLTLLEKYTISNSINNIL